VLKRKLLGSWTGRTLLLIYGWQQCLLRKIIFKESPDPLNLAGNPLHVSLGGDHAPYLPVYDCHFVNAERPGQLDLRNPFIFSIFPDIFS
jgi:hypothetical protein